ncbi:probable E3 ubiquitin-protein ligase ARI2 [Rutidosis leptorrhynchoides]|uniref:probable E3 ubiquitin-protein ligase ARI2 n=1 Tax=Rutidosis leptorrhynchoides TaxID=125765 RepID=UPI003A99B64A
MELLNIKEHQARTLLIHYRWDVDKVIDVYVNKGKDRLYEEACVMVNHNSDVSSVRIQRSSVALCEICMEEVPIYKMTTMDCGHSFCNNCWTEHFVVKINEGQSRRISCMAYKCNVVCDEDKIRIYVNEKDPELGKKFDQFLLESYIEDNKMVKWCPSVPHCGNAIRVDDDGCCEVECACGFQFCFSCSSEAHSPCSCHMWALWVKKFEDDSETINWMIANTKNCPTCLKPVEKNGGCNHVVCACGKAFCWLCGGATGFEHNWDRIKNHTCGRYKEEYVVKMERAKSELIRYAHYLKFYEAHTNSLKAEIALKKKLKEKISGMKVTAYIKDYTWVIDGADRLVRSRQILRCTYPFAYCMFGDTFLGDEMTKEDKNVKQNLFEDQQLQFEGYVEKLSFVLAEPFERNNEEGLMEFRMKILELSKLIDVLCKNLYDCIDNEILIDLGRTINIAPYRSNGADKAVELHH